MTLIVLVCSTNRLTYSPSDAHMPADIADDSAYQLRADVGQFDLLAFVDTLDNISKVQQVVPRYKLGQLGYLKAPGRSRFGGITWRQWLCR